MRLLMMVFYLIVIFFGVSFAALNASSVQVNFYFTKLAMPISVLIIITLGLGMFLGFLMLLYRYWCLKMEYFKLKNQFKLTEKEIKNLRAIPLQDQP